MEIGSLLGGQYPLVEKKMQVLQEIVGAKIIYKSFETGDKMPSHSNPTDVFVIVQSGKMEIKLEGVANIFQTGDFIHFPGKALHELLCIENAKILIIK
ncbi:cupin domain-containing protein [Arcicella aquatica]|uniref:Cupin domain-containing protein n=1 Tax=Arcicella aquatica TaxID=217141 RepID=A0ABU5QLC9_9BACT|nr:cupin domain-containing protein [Arcicella aquatica]MEA5257862.1 cupin domain-containing protein [Arcicella aquatica]